MGGKNEIDAVAALSSVQIERFFFLSRDIRLVEVAHIVGFIRVATTASVCASMSIVEPTFGTEKSHLKRVKTDFSKRHSIGTRKLLMQFDVRVEIEEKKRNRRKWKSGNENNWINSDWNIHVEKKETTSSLVATEHLGRSAEWSEWFGIDARRHSTQASRNRTMEKMSERRLGVTGVDFGVGTGSCC